MKVKSESEVVPKGREYSIPRSGRRLILCAQLYVRLFGTLWTVACQTPLSMAFSRQEHWSGLPFPLPGDLPDPSIEPKSLMPLALAGRFFTNSATKVFNNLFMYLFSYIEFKN